ncbi:MAG: cupredoxin domain-containing protein [Acidimicrobiia bacterium]
MNRRRPPTRLLALVVPLIALTALTATRIAEGPSTTAVATGRRSVTIKNFAFTPTRLSVAQGTMLAITNADATAHTFSARDGSFDTLVAPGATKTIRLDQAGTFAYSCKIHPSMKGTLVVK